MQNTLDRIVSIVTDIAPNPADVTPTSSFDDLALDSLACIELVVAVEDEWNVEITCGDRMALEGLADLAALVDARIYPTALAA